MIIIIIKKKCPYQWGWCLRILLIATCLGPTRKSAQFGLTLRARYNLLIMLIMTVGVKKNVKYIIGIAFIHELYILWTHFSFTETIKLIIGKKNHKQNCS